MTDREKMAKLMGDAGEEERSKLYKQLRKYIRVCVVVFFVTLFVVMTVRRVYFANTEKPTQSRDAKQAQILKDFMDGKPVPSSQAWWVHERTELNFDPALQNLCHKYGIDYERAHDAINRAQDTYLMYTPKKAGDQITMTIEVDPSKVVIPVVPDPVVKDQGDRLEVNGKTYFKNPEADPEVWPKEGLPVSNPDKPTEQKGEGGRHIQLPVNQPTHITITDEGVRYEPLK